MYDFFRFPHTPHLAWLGDNTPRDDKVLSSAEVMALLDYEVVVEEKLDGANLGISIDEKGNIKAQNRGQYLLAPYTGQFSRFHSWLEQHEKPLQSTVDTNLILFGEWCAARHTLNYSNLPDWFFLFDVYDRSAKNFWSVQRRNSLARQIGLKIVPKIITGKMNLPALQDLVADTPSHYSYGSLEGVVIRQELGEWGNLRAKLVHPDFVQSIETHWRKRKIEWNHLDFSAQYQSDV